MDNNKIFEINIDENIQIANLDDEKTNLSKIEMIDHVLKNNPTLSNKYNLIIEEVKKEFNENVSYKDIDLYYNDGEVSYNYHLNNIYG